MIPFNTLRKGIQHERWRSLSRQFQQLDASDSTKSAILKSEQRVSSARIGEHKFFAVAAESRRAVTLWVEQELSIMNSFSQLLLAVGSSLPNVFIRTQFLEVALSEHGEPSGAGSPPHPILLRQLAQAVDVDPNTAQLRAPTQRYLDSLLRLCESPLRALGAIGVGNKLLLVDEYSAAVKACSEAFGSDVGAPFFRANIDSDRRYYEICAMATASLCDVYELSPTEYDEGARRAIRARVRFYDNLLSDVTCPVLG